MKERIKDIISYSDMIGSLVKKDLRGKYKGSVLGFLWTFINPLCQIIVYTIVFSVIVRSNLDKFYVYMIVGMIPNRNTFVISTQYKSFITLCIFIGYLFIFNSIPLFYILKNNK